MKRSALAFLVSCATLAIAFAGACVGDDPSGAPPVTGADSGNDSSTTTGSDASRADAPISDTGMPDSATASDGGADSACANTFPTADFCDDFDNGGYQPKWTRVEAFPGVTIALVSTPHFSSPFALSARTSAVVTAAAANLVLESQTTTAGATQITLEARIQQPAASSSTNAGAPEAMSLAVGPNSYVLFQIRPSSELAACTAPGQQLGGFGTGDIPFTYGAWHSVKLEAVVVGGNINVSCYVDGITKSGTTTSTVDANAKARVGLVALTGQAPLTFLFDNVVLNAN